jgi:chromosome segregation ATPase
MVSSLSSKVNKLEAVLTTVLKESNTMVTSVQNQLRVEREGREKLQSECADLRHEVEQLRQTAKAAEGAIIQMKGTMESALHQMTRAQEENQAQLARSQEEARQESRQQFQLLIDAVRKGPEQGTNDSGYAK